MNIYDISWPISSSMTAYKDKKVVAVEHTKIFERDQVRESVIRLGAHSGTHLDAPAHFMQQGITAEQLPLDATLGHCMVVDCMHVQERIERKHLESLSLEPGSIVLLKTTNSLLEPTADFNYNFIYVAQSGADYLAEQHIKAVGVDYLGIERMQPEHATHITLMEHGVTIIEGLRLAAIQPGRYVLICLPLLIPGLEAAPARALLLKEA